MEKGQIMLLLIPGAPSCISTRVNEQRYLLLFPLILHSTYPHPNPLPSSPHFLIPNPPHTLSIASSHIGINYPLERVLLLILVLLSLGEGTQGSGHFLDEELLDKCFIFVLGNNSINIIS